MNLKEKTIIIYIMYTVIAGYFYLPYTSGAAKCNVQKCYEDAGIDLTGGSSSPPNW